MSLSKTSMKLKAYQALIALLPPNLVERSEHPDPTGRGTLEIHTCAGEILVSAIRVKGKNPQYVEVDANRINDLVGGQNLFAAKAG